MPDELRFCKFCGAPLEADMKVCAGCGQSVEGSGSPLEYLRGQAQQPQPTPVETPPPTPSLLEPAAETPPVEPPPPPRRVQAAQPPAPPKKSGFPVWLIVVIGVVLLCLCAGLVVGGVALYSVLRADSNSDGGFVPPMIETLEAPMQALTELPQVIETTLPEAFPTLPPPPEAVATLPPMPTMELAQSLSEDTITENFSSNRYEWADERDAISEHGFADGRYYIRVFEPEYFAWTFIPTEFNPTTVRVEAQVESGFEQGTYGVICNYIDGDHFDFIEIDLDTRAYKFARETLQETIPLTDQDWLDARFLNSDPAAVNTIEVQCSADRIQLSINGNLENAVTLAQPAEPDGWVALFTATWQDVSTEGFVVYFDNLFATTR